MKCRNTVTPSAQSCFQQTLSGWTLDRVSISQGPKQVLVAAMVWTLSPPKLVVEFNSHCELLKGWRLNPAMCLEIGPLGLTINSFIRREKNQSKQWMLPVSRHVVPLYHLGSLPTRRPIRDPVPWLWTRFAGHNKSLLFIIIQSVVSCY